jgi:peptidyl-tRNA hydrolase, PTH1 family
MNRRLGGKSGRHRGIRSVIDYLGSPNFTRVRIGISRPANSGSRYADQDEIVDYVLCNFSPQEEDITKTAVTSVAEEERVGLAQALAFGFNGWTWGGTPWSTYLG